MQKLFRSLIAIGGLAGLAACGDDVSITPPPPPDLVISGAPVTAIQVGAKVQLSANQAVTWGTSNNAVATVDGTGLVTAVTAGVASITATSTADATKKASVTITVSAFTTATISIQNITVTGTPGNTVDNNNVSGSIDVNMNVVPGDQVVDKVEVLIDGAVACTQDLPGALAAVSAEDVAAAEADIVSCQVNTAVFNTTTGVPTFKNGPHTFSARAVIVGGSQVATPTTPLIFNNVNTYLATLTLAGTTASATGADGLGYRRGSLNVAVLPVIYTAGTVTLASGSVTFGSAACDASPTNSARTATLTALSATFAQTGTAGTGNVVDYEYERGVCTLPETVTLNATDSQGNPLFTGASPSSASTPGIRLDNRAPAAPVVAENVNGRAGGWVNDAVAFNTVQASSNLNGMISAAVPDLGVNIVTYAARAAVTTSVATAAAGADISNPTSLSLSLANAVCVVFFAQDALGNRSSAGTGTCDAGDADNNTTVGVDRAAPVVAYDASSLAANARINTASIGGEFVLAVSDTGTAGVGVSGAVAPTATVARRDSANAAICQFGTVVSGACTPAAMTLVSTGIYRTTIAAVTVSGYYTFNGTARDAAGNTTAVASSRVIVHDAIAPALSPAQVSLANNFYQGGISQSFSSFANDNLDVWKADYELTYTGIPNISYGSTVINTFNAATLMNSNVSTSFTVPFFYRQMQVASGGTCPGTPVTVSGPVKPSAITGTLFDQANNTNVANTAIPATSVVTGSATAFPGTMCRWADSVSATTIGDGTVTPGTTPRTVTVFANAIGPTLTFNPPFTRVDFYYTNALGTSMTLIGTATSPSTLDPDPQGFRRHQYSISWTPGTAFATGGFIVAIGSTANGDGLATLATGPITIQP